MEMDVKLNCSQVETDYISVEAGDYGDDGIVGITTGNSDGDKVSIVLTRKQVLKLLYVLNNAKDFNDEG